MALFRKQQPPPVKPALRPEFEILISLLRDANKYTSSGRGTTSNSILDIVLKEINLIKAKQDG